MKETNTNIATVRYNAVDLAFHGSYFTHSIMKRDDRGYIIPVLFTSKVYIEKVRQYSSGGSGDTMLYVWNAQLNKCIWIRKSDCVEITYKDGTTKVENPFVFQNFPELR